MAETRIIGYDGNFAFGVAAADGSSQVHSAKIRTWSADFDMVTTETTAFGDAWRQFRGGIRGGRGSATGVLSFDATSTNPGVTDANRLTGLSSSTFTLTAAAGCTYTGAALVSNISISSDKTGDATCTFDFVFTGDVTETWDQTP